MEVRIDIGDRIKRLNELLARYIPPRETWTPADGSPAATSFLTRAGERIPPAVAFAILAQR